MIDTEEDILLLKKDPAMVLQLAVILMEEPRKPTAEASMHANFSSKNTPKAGKLRNAGVSSEMYKDHNRLSTYSKMAKSGKEAQFISIEAEPKVFETDPIVVEKFIQLMLQDDQNLRILNELKQTTILSNKKKGYSLADYKETF